MEMTLTNPDDPSQRVSIMGQSPMVPELDDEGIVHDPVQRPRHYNSHPSGIECIEVTRHMSFNLGNVVKYIWRDGLKDGVPEIQDLEKALWYLKDEINSRKKQLQEEG